MASDKIINEIYDEIIKYSWSDEIDNYYHFLIDNTCLYCKSEKETHTLIDLVLKKILKNLKDYVEIDKYDNIYVNMGRYKNQDANDFMIGLIKTYYKNEFKDGNKEYSTLDMMNSVIEQYKTNKFMFKSKIFSYMLATLFRLHYILYVLEYENN